MVNFESRKQMQGDPLELIRKLSSDIFDTQPARILLLVTTLTCLVLSVIHIYFFFRTFDIHFFAAYVPIFGWCNYGILTMVILLIKNDVISNLTRELRSWEIDSCGQVLAHRIRNEIKITHVSVTVTTIASICLGILFVIPDVNDENLIFTLVLLKVYCSKVPAQILGWTYRCSLAFQLYCMTVHGFQVLYGTQHIKFQFLMFHKCLANLTREYEDGKQIERLYCDAKYQKEIKKRLRFCCERYGELLRTANEKVKLISSLVPVFLIFGLQIAIGDLIMVFDGVSISYSRLFVIRGFVCFTTIILLLVAFVEGGQNVEDIMDKTHTNLTVDNMWFTWNQENKRTLLMLLILATKETKIRFTENICLNYGIAITFIKALFAMASMINTLQHL